MLGIFWSMGTAYKWSKFWLSCTIVRLLILILSHEFRRSGSELGGQVQEGTLVEQEEVREEKIELKEKQVQSEQ